MIRRTAGAATIALVMATLDGPVSLAQQQVDRPQSSAGTPADSREADRRRIVESDRWQQMGRTLHEWLSVQQVYPAEQVAAIRADLSARASQMSPRELEEFMHEMEERLDVLTSPEAEEARQWLAHFFATRRNPEAQLRRSRPDVLNMTASQIRQELQWLEQHRAGRQQSNSAFGQARALQQQTALGVHDARQQAQVAAADRRSRAAATQFRSPYAPRPQNLPNTSELVPKPMGTPIYSVSPWGTPIYWHPMAGQW
jgi:chemotaxis protein histidine kinase CheA